ncbi:MAG: response regulator transcription factor [Christensenellaceae bacterium]|jgi:two-component system alkaline phosphatase synthesis response regulator PhoP|nr:response regulator transcription factor [Christensenellaceae bacterium]MDR3085314.1 response regulator transcription factor [Christensenellaceae bacterium]
MPNDMILAVDDEVHILELISYNLKSAGYNVVTALTGEEALKRCEVEKPSLVLLDIMLPGIDGLEVCRRLKGDRSTSNIPIIMLTARGDEVDKILGLELGADDYITKPFSVRELAARVKSLLRRVAPQQESEPQTLRCGDIMIDITNYEAFKGGEKLSLTLKEFELLKVLVLSRGKVLTRDFLLDRIWGYEYYGETRTVDVHIRHLRQKLGEEPYIETVRGVGYRFVDKDQDS